MIVCLTPPATDQTALASTRTLTQYSHFSVYILKSNSSCIHFVKYSIILFWSLTSLLPQLGFPPLFPTSLWIHFWMLTVLLPSPAYLSFILDPLVNPQPCKQEWLGISSFTQHIQLYFQDHPSIRFKPKSICKRNMHGLLYM